MKKVLLISFFNLIPWEIETYDIDGWCKRLEGRWQIEDRNTWLFIPPHSVRTPVPKLNGFQNLVYFIRSATVLPSYSRVVSPVCRRLLRREWLWTGTSLADSPIRHEWCGCARLWCCWVPGMICNALVYRQWYRIYLEFTSIDMLFLCNLLSYLGIVLEGDVV